MHNTPDFYQNIILDKFEITIISNLHAYINLYNIDLLCVSQI